MKRNALMGLTIAILLLATAGVAPAGVKHGSRISMGYSPAAGGQFTGKVRSAAGCADRRKVVVFRARSGPDAAVGRTTSSSGGGWRLRTGTPQAGDYYAQATAQSRAGGVRCGGARSALTHVS